MGGPSASAARSDRLDTLAGRLARLGLGEWAVPVLERMGVAPGDTQAESQWRRVEAMLSGADPERALRAFERLAERAPSSWVALRAHAARDLDPLRRTAALAGASDTLSELLCTDPGLLAVLTGDLRPHPAERVVADTGAVLRHPGIPPARALARAQRRGLARVALRDLLGMADTPAITGELTALAEGVLAAGLDRAKVEAGIDVPLSLIAMGKLGGGELNYVSDVDVLFVAYPRDLPAATKVAERFLRLSGTVTPEGRAYEVDPTLRPEGRDGALVRGLDGYRAYYERWAATWEFQALLKARPVAGDVELGAAFVDLITPFVWPDHRAAAAVDEIQRLKAVVEGSAKVRRAGDRELKLAPGGLRDIEFATQLLQLVHGRHDVTLRERGTLPALHALAAGGYVGEEDARLFSQAYAFLRTIEHRLQLRALRRTHALPADVEPRQRLARTLGYHDGFEARAVDAFEADLREVRAQVRQVHEKLFYRPLLGRFAEVRARELVGMPSDGGLDRDAVADRLVALGFAEPETALRHLDALTRGTGRRARLLRTLLPTILPVLAETPDPDGGLAALRSLAERLEASPTLLAALRDRPPVAERLAAVLGSSPLVGRWLERQPEVLPLLADEAGLAERRTTADYRRLASGLARRHSDEAGVGDALRRVIRRELARIAIRELTGAADTTDVAVELSGLAEACLETAVHAVVGRESPFSLAVIGMGKLGGRELVYGSDLDILVVYEPADGREEALRATARLLRLLSGPTAEGRAFEVDPNLRPEGRDGPLARSLASYQTYYERWAEPWELQALTQARPVAGDLAIGRAFIEVLAGIVYPAVVPPERLAAVREMKRRVETERPRGRRSGGEVDLKIDPGGLIDVEWTVQLLQLAYGGQLPRLRRRGTQAALVAAESEGVLGEEDARVLREGYQLLTRLRHALFLSGVRDAGTLPGDDAELAAPAHLLDPRQRDPAALRQRVAVAMRAIRDIHERVFYSEDWSPPRPGLAAPSARR